MNRILVVDDKDENLYYLQTLLSAHGWEVNVAHNGDEALEVARQAPPDLIVSDLLMPGMDGYSLLRHWKSDEQLANIPFVVYTATYTQAEDEDLAIKWGADAFILKPAEPEAFVERIRDVYKDSLVAQRVPVKPPSINDEKLMKMYSATLIRKLEEKSLELKVANESLQNELLERNKVVAALEASEADFRILSETMPQIIWLTKPDGWNYHFNQKWFEYTGKTFEDSVGYGWRDVIHPDDQPIADKRWQHSLQTGAVYEIEYRLRRIDGSYRWMLGRALPLRDSSGAVTKWFGTCTDVDDLKQAQAQALLSEQEQRELALQLAKERERLIVAQAVAKVGSWELDLKTMQGTWSTETYRIYEVPDDFIPSFKAIVALIHPEDQQKVSEAFGRSIDQAASGGDIAETVNSIIYRIVTASGLIKFIEGRWEVQQDAGGNPLRGVGTIQDITERRILQQQLQQSQRMESVGQLTGGIAHDFNNILTVILGNTELLIEQLEDHPSLNQLAKTVSTAAQQGAELTQRLLAFARRQMLEPQPVNVNKLVAKMQSMLHRSLGGHITIHFEPEENLWPCLVDPVQLESALLNLCINARDAMTDGGELRITTENIVEGGDHKSGTAELPIGDYVLLAVADTGCGIPQKDLQKVFEPFFSTKEKGKGTGLGLAMIYGFIKQSGGHVSIYSTEGLGTMVKLYLPRSIDNARETKPEASIDTALAGGNETILLVEDEKLVRDFAGTQLRALGYHVIEAENGVAALALLRNNPAKINLLFTDMVMPGGISGDRLAAEACQLIPELRVLYTSGYTEDGFAKRPQVEPGRRMLGKPYRRITLAKAVRELLDDDR